MPFNEFEGDDSWGYNPSFYFAPDKAYVPKNEYKRFIDLCHQNGIAVIMDLVLNHSCAVSYGSNVLGCANSRPAANNPCTTLQPLTPVMDGVWTLIIKVATLKNLLTT